MIMNIKLFPKRIDLLYSLGIEKLQELLINQLHTLGKRLGFTCVFAQLERSFKIVHDGQEALEHVGLAISDNRCQFILCSFLEIVEIGNFAEKQILIILDLFF